LTVRRALLTIPRVMLPARLDGTASSIGPVWIRPKPRQTCRSRSRETDDAHADG
jgi:hypothetical protein